MEGINLTAWERSGDERPEREHRRKPDKECPREPGTIIRIFIPAGAAIEIGPLRITSPDGICLVISLQDLENLDQLIDLIQQAGGSVTIGNTEQTQE